MFENFFKIMISAFLVISSTSTTAFAQALTLSDSGRIIGTPIHISEGFTYYDCNEVVGDKEFIEGLALALTQMSEAFGIAPPQNSRCVLSQGNPNSFFQNSISLHFHIDPENATCFYVDYCNDSRTASLMPTSSGIDINLMVVNADKKITEQWCASAQRGFLPQGCRM